MTYVDRTHPRNNSGGNNTTRRIVSQRCRDQTFVDSASSGPNSRTAQQVLKVDGDRKVDEVGRDIIHGQKEWTSRISRVHSDGMTGEGNQCSCQSRNQNCTRQRHAHDHAEIGVGGIQQVSGHANRQP